MFSIIIGFLLKRFVTSKYEISHLALTIVVIGMLERLKLQVKSTTICKELSETQSFNKDSKESWKLVIKIKALRRFDEERLDV